MIRKILNSFGSLGLMFCGGELIDRKKQREETFKKLIKLCVQKK